MVHQSDVTPPQQGRPMTGAEMVLEYAVRHGAPYAVGIPGHGSWTLTDALRDRPGDIEGVQVMHEQSAVHLADGYYRASGQPLVAFTSVGPGAVNTAVGMATAYVDSTAVFLMTGSTLTYMRGHSTLQELDRTYAARFPHLLESVVKEWWQPSHIDEVPFVLQRAWSQMMSGRPGPVLVDLAMDLQTATKEVVLPTPSERTAGRRSRPAADDIERAARLLAGAERPVIVVGGGVITANASADLTQLAERLGAAVVTTWMGKGAIDEEHGLNAFGIGDTASTSGNRIAAQADVILAIGCRFTDWSASSFRRGVTFEIPPAKLIQVDIDAREIGKNYPVEVALLGDCREALVDLAEALGPRSGTEPYTDTSYFAHIQREKAAWEKIRQVKAMSSNVPMTQARAICEVQAATRPDAIVVTGAGVPQGAVRQNWISRVPRTHITSGGFSTMGFTIPAAIGAQLAEPDRQVIGVAGDGDFLQTMQEIAAAAMLGTPVCTVILDNQGWISIKGGQENFLTRSSMTDFLLPDGSVYHPDYRKIGDAFGLHAEHVDRPEAVKGAVERALASGRPSLVAIDVARDYPDAGLERTGWWDIPVPAHYPEQYERQQDGRAEEQHV